MEAIFIVFMIFFMIMPVIAFFALCILAVIMYRSIQARQRQESIQASQALRQFAEENQYHFTPSESQWRPSGSLKNGSVTSMITGLLSKTQSRFWHYYQTEIRRSGDRTITYKRSVLCVEIPDTMSHFIINSRLNDAGAHKHDLHQYAKVQNLQLEGDFSQYFDVLRPLDSGSDILVLLTPDVMKFLLKKLYEYDIEIENNFIYIYTYKHVKPQKIQDLIALADQFIKILKLHKKTGHADKPVSQKKVAHIAADTTSPRRLTKRSRWTIGGIVSAVITMSASASLLLARWSESQYATIILALHIALIPIALVIAFLKLRKTNVRRDGHTARYKNKTS